MQSSKNHWTSQLSYQKSSKKLLNQGYPTKISITEVDTTNINKIGTEVIVETGIFNTVNVEIWVERIIDAVSIKITAVEVAAEEIILNILISICSIANQGIFIHILVRLDFSLPRSTYRHSIYSTRHILMTRLYKAIHWIQIAFRALTTPHYKLTRVTGISMVSHLVNKDLEIIGQLIALFVATRHIRWRIALK